MTKTAAAEWTRSFADDAAMVILRDALQDDALGNSRRALESASANIRDRFCLPLARIVFIHQPDF